MRLYQGARQARLATTRSHCSVDGASDGATAPRRSNAAATSAASSSRGA